mgnify:CR=1 FL=1
MSESVDGHDASEFRQSVARMLQELDPDAGREGLRDTPKRVEKAFQFYTSGYSQTPEQVIGDGLFEAETDEMILVKNIELYSLCEHHLAPFFGKAHVAYIPSDKIVGLSKVARVVEIYARRLQVQERLTMQIAKASAHGDAALAAAICAVACRAVAYHLMALRARRASARSPPSRRRARRRRAPSRRTRW